ncbi:hypothetical protein Q5752_002281 [Cryptotrichosporon argae]
MLAVAEVNHRRDRYRKLALYPKKRQVHLRAYSFGWTGAEPFLKLMPNAREGFQAFADVLVRRIASWADLDGAYN